MKYIKTITICLLAVQGFGQYTPDSLLKTLVAIEQKLMDGIVNGDKKLWDEHLHDSCMISLEDGTTISKKKMIEELDPLPAGYVGKIKIIDPNLKVYGNTAVLSFVDDEYLDLYNQHIHTQYRQVNTWVKINDNWKKIAMQIFEIPKNPPPVTFDSSVLKKYVGTYALSAERTAVVYVEKTQLYVKKGNRDPVELLAQTENVFFRKGDGRVDIIFLKETNGSYKMIERREGEDLVWKKN